MCEATGGRLADNDLMAQNTTIELIDDLDPEYQADETVRFGIDGVSYEIDLHVEHAEELRAALERFVSNGRRVGQQARGRGSTARSTTVRRDGTDPKVVREWAKEQGITVNDRGRVPLALIAQFSEATG